MLRLNPLGIGEGFELSTEKTEMVKQGLNPLGIGEGFEQLLTTVTVKP